MSAVATRDLLQIQSRVTVTPPRVIPSERRLVLSGARNLARRAAFQNVCIILSD